jgi:hypothetical protein
MKIVRKKPRATAARLNAWEAALRVEIRARLACTTTDADTAPFARFNFLVHAGRVFFIDIARWWHSVPGDARKVARRLRADGVPVVSVRLLHSDAKYTPYFGRKRDEEKYRGWNDPTIFLYAGKLADEDAMRAAWDAHRARLMARKIKSRDQS